MELDAVERTVARALLVPEGVDASHLVAVVAVVAPAQAQAQAQAQGQTQTQARGQGQAQTQTACQPASAGGGDGATLLVAFVARPPLAAAAPRSTAALRQALLATAHVPPTHIPALLLLIDDLPLTATGKLDRAALQRTAEEFTSAQGGRERPRGRGVGEEEGEGRRREQVMVSDEWWVNKSREHEGLGGKV